MPSCDAFPERVGRYELDECEEDGGRASHVSYVTEDGNDQFFMEAYDRAQRYPEITGTEWDIDIFGWDRGSGHTWEYDFGAASTMAFDDDEIIDEMETLGQSIDPDDIRAGF